MLPVEGDWIRWTMPGLVMEGQVLQTAWPSLVVRWLGGVEQVFPLGEMYWSPEAAPIAKMEVIPEPKEALRVQRDVDREQHSVLRAAKSLGTTQKQVRAWLRSGKLKGEQVDGKWVHVDPTSMENLRA